MRAFKGKLVRFSLMSASLAAIAVSATPAMAQAQVREFNIPAQTLSSALLEFSRQSDVLIVVAPELTEGKRSPALHASLPVNEAIARLLQGSGLSAVPNPRGGYRIERSAARSEPSQTTASLGEEATENKNSADIIVTGSHIRGAQPTSPVVTISQNDMRLAGHNNLGEAIRALPQNFSGGQNPGVALGSTSGGLANQNISGSSGLNLRGLGPDATLTLLNGRRLPYDGFTQATDVSVIPTAAIDRIEILLDGASAIYGSDAVGGVANIVLKRDYQGVELSARYGGATDGGYEQQQYTIVGGHSWGSGGFLLTGDWSKNTAVRARQRDYLSNIPYQDMKIYPESDQKGLLFSGHQKIASFVEISLDSFYTKRNTEYVYAYSSTSGQVFSPRAKIWGVSPSLKFDLPGDWQLRLNGSVGRSKISTTGRVFNLSSGAQTSQSGTVYINKAAAAWVETEGPLFALPGGDARLSLGGGWRRNSFDQNNLITGALQTGGISRSLYGYAEVGLPLISEDQAIPLIHRLFVTGALRHESYNKFGTTTTPKIGALWTIIPAIDLKASWGRSFKVPSLTQLYSRQYVYLYPATTWGGAAAGAPSGAQVINTHGGNPDLRPEKAETIALGIVAKPGFLPGFHLEANWFQIRYENRIANALIAAQALSNPAFAELVTFNPTAAQISGAFAWAGFPEGTFSNNYTGAAYDPARVFAIVNSSYQNVSTDILRGLDLSGRYRADALGGSLSLTASGSWLLDAKRNITSNSPTTPIAGVAYRPAKFKGRIGASWSHGGFTFASTLNHISGVIDTNVTPNVRRSSMTTVDAVLNYDMKSSPLGAMEFNISLMNIFNQSPPFLKSTQPYYVSYDSTNYSAIGRTINVSFTKRF